MNEYSEGYLMGISDHKRTNYPACGLDFALGYNKAFEDKETLR